MEGGFNAALDVKRGGSVTWVVGSPIAPTNSPRRSAQVPSLAARRRTSEEAHPDHTCACARTRTLPSPLLR